MPVLPTQHSASSSRQSSQSPNKAPSFIADTSSRIRLRNSDNDENDWGPDTRSPFLLLTGDIEADFSLIQSPSDSDISSYPAGDPQHHNALRRRTHTPSTDSHHELLPAHLTNPSAVQSRQTQYFFAIPLSYAGLNAGPSPGTVVGITLGSVLGFLILVYLIQSVLNSPPGRTRYIEGDASEIVVTRRSDRGGGGGGKRHRSSRRTTTRSRRTGRSETASAQSASVSGGSASVAPPPPRQPAPIRTERIIREEVRVRQESRAPPVAMPMPPGGLPEMRETININIDERGPGRVDGDDMVEVVEEHSDVSGPPPGARRSQRVGSRGAYRTVDPGAYGGGNYPPRPVRR